MKTATPWLAGFFCTIVIACGALADSRLQNMSTRGRVGTGDDVLIGGLIIPGTGSKTVVLRARAPSIDPALVATEDQLADPQLQLFSAEGVQLEYNDNWQEHAAAGLIPAALQPTHPSESAIYATLDAGPYTAIVSGVGATTGVALVEIFEVNASDPAKLSNISTRGVAGTGDNVMIGGLIISGDTPKTVAIRAIGPSIDPAFVAESDQLQDPQLQLFSGATQVDYNNNWQDAANAGDLPGGLRPTDPAESVILVTLDPGAYTAIVSGVNNTTGVGLVEVFEIETPAAAETAEAFFAENISAPVIQARCIACHAEGGIAMGTPLVYAADTVDGHLTNNFNLLRDYVAEDLSRTTHILQKARGVNHTGGVIFTTDTAEYMALEAFVDLLAAELGETNNPPDTGFWAGVSLAGPAETLRRAALIVARRLPTDGELAAVASGDENNLRATIGNLMDGEGFHEFLVEGANDRLHTDAFINGLFLEVGDLNIADYLPVGAGLYFDEQPETDDERDAKYRWINRWQYGLARAPVELIAHVVENDLPYTEILTADYTMVNPIAAQIMRSDVSFDTDDHRVFMPGQHNGQVLRDDFLVSEFIQGLGVQVTAFGNFIDYPHAGVLNTQAFLNRYPTTETNRNRARARWTFFHFLGVDIEQSAARTTDPVALADSNNPTMNNPACTVCHAVMDPLAGAFQNYGNEGFYRDSQGGRDSLPETYKHPEWFNDNPPTTAWQEGDTWFRDMRNPGIGDETVPDANASLPWVATRITADPRFATAAIKFWWPALMGTAVASAPQVSTDSNHAVNLAAFEAQDTFIESLGATFSNGIEGGTPHNARDLLTEMIMSPWFRAISAADPTGAASLAADAGGRRLLTPSELERKTATLLGWRWGEADAEWQLDLRWTALIDQFGIYYGGTDSNGIQARARALTSLMANVAERQAIGMACPAVVVDFERDDGERLLFNGISKGITPLTEFGNTFEISAADYSSREPFSIAGELVAGERNVVIFFRNDWYDEIIGDRNVLLDALSVVDADGNEVMHLEMEDLGSVEGAFVGCGDAQWNAATGLVDHFNLWSSCELRVPVTIPADGLYQVELTGWASQAGPDLPIIDVRVESIDPQNSNGALAIKAKLAELHNQLLGEALTPLDDEVTQSYQLLVDTWLARRASATPDVAWEWGIESCNFPEQFASDGSGDRRADPSAMLNTWSSSLIYFLTDYNYLHE